MRLPKKVRLLRYAVREFRDIVLRPEAGAYAQGKYRVYGEGSEWHNGHKCRYGMHQYDRHPLIERSDWDSKWEYRKSRIADWWATVEMIRQPPGPEGVAIPVVPPTTWLDRAMHKAFGKPYRDQRVWAALRPKDSIYPRDRS